MTAFTAPLTVQEHSNIGERWAAGYDEDSTELARSLGTDHVALLDLAIHILNARHGHSADAAALAEAAFTEPRRDLRVADRGGDPQADQALPWHIVDDRAHSLIACRNQQVATALVDALACDGTELRTP
ncbi:hypothetical protein [Dietzia sp. 179-F 9C3 NHS]|uniref:hypothetical protein n=1 Tax=Dietzia sp. 179-F 9C3 NHS TaxID=3374295 RepID=UPI00387A1F7A